MTTLTAPAVPAGVVAVISESLTNVYEAATPPMDTAVAPVKPLPVMITEVPPAVVPDVGKMLEKTGAGTTVVVAVVVVVGVGVAVVGVGVAVVGVGVAVVGVGVAVVGVGVAVVGVGVAVVGVDVGVVVTVELSADADEVTIPRTTMVRQKTRKKVLVFIHIPAQDTFVSHCPEAVLPV